MFKRLFKLVKAVALLDNRFQPGHLNGANEIFQRAAVPNPNPLNNRRFQQQLAGWQRDFTAAQNANHRYATMNGNGSQGMPQVLPADGFDNMVDTAIVGQLIYLFRPVAFEPVNAVIGTELFGLRQLFIAAGGDKNLCPLRFCNLQSEYRDPSGALTGRRVNSRVPPARTRR